MVDDFRKASLSCFEPKGAFYVFPCITSTGLVSDVFCEKLLLEERVLVVPSNTFRACGTGFIQATYANSMENILEAIKKLSVLP